MTKTRSAIFAVAALAVFPGWLVGQSNYHAELRQAEMREFLAGHYARAETLMLQAVESALHGNDKYTVALDYSALGDIYQVELRLPEAEQTYRKAIATLPQQFPKTDLPDILWKLAGVLTAERQFDGALAAINEASKFMIKNRLQDPQLDAEILNDLGVIALYRGKTRKAETYFKRASSIQFVPHDVLQDAVELDPGDILNNLGSVYQRTHQYAKAEDAFKRSLESLQGRLGDSHPNLVTTLTNLGYLYAVTGRYKEAEDQYQRSRAILERSGLSVRNERLLMLTLHGLAKAYIGEHQEMQAEPLLAQALDIVHRISMPAVDMPTVVDLLETYSKLLRHSLNPSEAERVQAEAQRIRASMAFTVRANGTSR